MENDKPENHGRRLPPAENRWKKGMSGNPRGRPKKKDSLTSLLKEEIKKICPADRQKRTWEELMVLEQFDTGCILRMAILLRRHKSDGATVLERFTAEDSGGLWARRCELGGAGRAVWGQLRLHQEATETTVAKRADGASAAEVWRTPAGDGKGASPVAGDDTAAARPDAGRTATEVVRSRPGAVECIGAVAGNRADGTALKKSRSTPKSKTRRKPSSAVRHGGTR